MICVYCRRDYQAERNFARARFCSVRCKAAYHNRAHTARKTEGVEHVCPCGATYHGAEQRAALCPVCKASQHALAGRHDGAAKRARVLRKAVGEASAPAVAQALGMSRVDVALRFVGRWPVTPGEAATCASMLGRREAIPEVTVEQLLDRTVAA